MTRKARIETDQFDLEAIAAHLQSGDITVVREGDGYYLTSPEIDAAPDDTRANEIVAKILSQINALGRIHDANFHQVKLSRYTDDNGRSVVTGAIGATMQPSRAAMTGTVTYPDAPMVRMAWLEGDQVDLQDLANLLLDVPRMRSDAGRAAAQHPLQRSRLACDCTDLNRTELTAKRPSATPGHTGKGPTSPDPSLGRSARAS